MSHYTDQNRISDKAWMNSVLGQMGLKKSSKFNSLFENAPAAPAVAPAAPAPGAAPAVASKNAIDPSKFQPQELSAPTNMDALKAVSQEDINFYSTAMDKYERQGMSGVQAAEAVVKQYGLVHWLLQWAKDNEKNKQ